MEEEEAAPVPPSEPDTSMTSAPALAMPTAMVPMSVTAGIFTDTFAPGCTCRRL